MRPERTFCVGSHPCQGYRRTSCNGWDWVLLSTGSLKFRQWEPDGANGEIDFFEVILRYSGTQTLFKRHVKPGNQGVSCSPSLRSSGPPLNPMECAQANALCERLIGPLRRECFEFLIPLSANHVRWILREWVPHYNTSRPH